MKVKIAVERKSDLEKEKGSYKMVLTAGFKCGSKIGTTIIEELRRRSGMNKKEHILVGHVP